MGATTARNELVAHLVRQALTYASADERVRAVEDNDGVETRVYRGERLQGVVRLSGDGKHMTAEQVDHRGQK